MVPVIDRDTCSGCGKCSEVCPPQAISMRDGIARIEKDLCEECGFCAPECPLGAISIPFPMSSEATPTS